MTDPRPASTSRPVRGPVLGFALAAGLLLFPGGLLLSAMASPSDAAPSPSAGPPHSAQIPLPTVADTAGVLRIFGEVRPRAEARTPAFPAAPPADLSVRLRVGVEARPSPRFRAVLGVQEVGLVGGDSGVGLDREEVDLFVAYAQVEDLPGGSWLRVGRQELVAGNQRLVSNNNWGQRGQRFDAVRLSGRAGGSAPGPAGQAGAAGLDWTLFASRVADVSGFSPQLHGLHLNQGVGAGAVHGFLLYHRDRLPGAEGSPVSVQRVTAGGQGSLPLAGTALLVEGYLQTGSWGEADISAWMASLGVRRPVQGGTLEVRGDFLSGDAPGTRESGVPAGAFDRLRGSNHGFHGYLDLLTRFPQATAGEGLVDLQLRYQRPLAGGVVLEATLHHFRTESGDPGAAARLGEELDLVLRTRVHPRISLEAGGSYLRAGDALARTRGFQNDDLRFVYLMSSLLW